MYLTGDLVVPSSSGWCIEWSPQLREHQRLKDHPDLKIVNKQKWHNNAECVSRE
jgi:hypothetical protein